MFTLKELFWDEDDYGNKSFNKNFIRDVWRFKVMRPIRDLWVYNKIYYPIWWFFYYHFFEEIKPYVFYEDCSIRPHVCVRHESDGTITGVDMLTGDIRMCDDMHCGVRKMTERRAYQIKYTWPLRLGYYYSEIDDPMQGEYPDYTQWGRNEDYPGYEGDKPNNWFNPFPGVVAIVTFLRYYAGTLEGNSFLDDGSYNIPY